MNELVQRSVQLIVEGALEGRVKDLLGHGYDERGEGDPGYRNCCRRGR